ncbi:MAG TPA: FecR domain-containing protein [Polyangiaceae bacterium]|nr:FecR domain-containing protein [Polyangiaceae bacterium]
MTRLGALFTEIAYEEDELLARTELADRLALRLGRAPPPPKRRQERWKLALAAVAAAAVVGAVLAIVTPPATLAVKMSESGGPPLLGAWLGAPQARPLSLEFSDGSRFELAPGSKARLVTLAQSGARVELAAGTLRVHVVPRKATDFRLDAGPFGVHVTGTRFEMSYRPESEAFELFLEEGQVELTGCVFGQGRKLAAGQSVRASCGERSLDVSFGRRSAEPQKTPAEPSRPALEATASPSPHETQSTVSNAPRSERSTKTQLPESSWVTLARSGAFAEAFSAARSEGFEAECARVSAAELALLADVARHAKESRRAEQALLTLRRRFPGTNDAALAAFGLGRLEFDERGAYSKAAGWFRTYLNERPSGAMTREALGRLVEACYRSKDAAGAREAATRYLREYPSGPHAELASRVVASP